APTAPAPRQYVAAIPDRAKPSSFPLRLQPGQRLGHTEKRTEHQHLVAFLCLGTLNIKRRAYGICLPHRNPGFAKIVSQLCGRSTPRAIKGRHAPVLAELEQRLQ